jgi:hypothetical protein
MMAIVGWIATGSAVFLADSLIAYSFVGTPQSILNLRLSRRFKLILIFHQSSLCHISYLVVIHMLNFRLRSL